MGVLLHSFAGPKVHFKTRSAFLLLGCGRGKEKKIIILEPENLGKRGHLLCRGKFLLVLIKLGATRGHQGGGGGGEG